MSGRRAAGVFATNRSFQLTLADHCQAKQVSSAAWPSCHVGIGRVEGSVSGQGRQSLVTSEMPLSGQLGGRATGHSATGEVREGNDYQDADHVSSSGATVCNVGSGGRDYAT